MFDRDSRLIVLPAMLLVTIMAQAGPAQAREETIRYQPHELQSQAGRQALLARITASAQRACGSGSRPSHLKHEEGTLCQVDLAARMVQRIDNRDLTALWSSKVGNVQLASRSR